MVLMEIKNDIKKLNYNMVECGYKILNKEELSMDNMEIDKEKINERIYKIEEFFTKTTNPSPQSPFNLIIFKIFNAKPKFINFNYNFN